MILYIENMIYNWELRIDTNNNINTINPCIAYLIEFDVDCIVFCLVISCDEKQKKENI